MLNKPLVLEEFGLARDGGSLDPAAAATYRDDFFGQLYAAVEANAEGGGAIAYIPPPARRNAAEVLISVFFESG